MVSKIEDLLSKSRSIVLQNSAQDSESNLNQIKETHV